MSMLFNPPTPPVVPPAPPPPALAAPAIATRSTETQRERAQGGRASQFLTMAQTQQTPDPSQQRYLGAA